MVESKIGEKSMPDERYITVTGKHSIPPEEFKQILASVPVVDLRTTKVVPKPLRW